MSKTSLGGAQGRSGKNLRETSEGFQGCPRLGVGLGLRRSLLEETLNATDLIDWVEITPENYMGRGGRSRRTLERAKAVYPLVSHGVSMSIGSVDPWDEKYLKELKALFADVEPPWFSDHLCFSGVDGQYFNDLIPLPRTPETVRYVADRIRFLQDTFERPVLVENISYYLEYPENTMPDEVFLREVLETADCGLLLDVNNVYVNSRNHGFDPYAYLGELPLERVVQIHTAGHHEYPEGLLDTHGNAVCEPVWELLAWVLARCNPCGVMLERDLYMPAFSELTPELEKIRQIWDACRMRVEAGVSGIETLTGEALNDADPTMSAAGKTPQAVSV